MTREHAGPAVLVLDDNKGNRHFAQILLKPEGYLVLQAPDITEALAILERQPVDLVVADVRMPSGGGFELYASLRNGPHAATPFLVMSASVTPELRERARHCPGVTLVERPIDPDEYIALVKDATPKR